MENTTNNTPTASAPTHIAYQVQEAKDGKSYWNRVGAAWAHKDNKGFSLQLDSLPLDGKVMMRLASESK